MIESERNCRVAVATLLVNCGCALPAWNLANLLRFEFSREMVETSLRKLHQEGYLIVVRRGILSVNDPSYEEDCYLAIASARNDFPRAFPAPVTRTRPVRAFGASKNVHDTLDGGCAAPKRRNAS